MASQNEFWQGVAHKYRDAGNRWPASSKDMAGWAIDNGLWNPQPSAIRAQCAEMISKALREDYFYDKRGRKVRRNHAVKQGIGAEQFTLWDDISTAEPKHMRLAFQQRRRQILGDCTQLRNDVDSYNEMRTPDMPVVMIYNFELDLQEAELAMAA